MCRYAFIEFHSKGHADACQKAMDGFDVAGRYAHTHEHAHTRARAHIQANTYTCAHTHPRFISGRLFPHARSRHTYVYARMHIDSVWYTMHMHMCMVVGTVKTHGTERWGAGVETHFQEIS